MGQFLSNLRRWFSLNKRFETPKNDHDHHHDTNYQTFSGHYITIPDHQLTTTEIIVHNHDINSSPSTLDIVVDSSSGFEEVTKKQKRKNKKKVPNTCHGDQLIKEALLDKNVTCTTSINHNVLSNIGKIGSYTSSQKILVVGEGDFSFSTCLAITFGSTANNITATSLNNLKFLTKNYTMFGKNKVELESRGSTVLHGVNAISMVKHQILGSMVFDRIIFNFPHAGNFCATDIRLHQNLISGFLRNAKEMIQDNGEIHITSKSNGFYLEWDVPKLGSDMGLNLIQEVKFRRSKYPGYSPKYGYGGDRDFDCNPSKTYKFGVSIK